MPRTKLQNQLEFPKVPEFVRPDLYGVTWGLSEVSKMVKRDTKFVSKYVLKPNRRVLDVKYGGPVKFPAASNDEKSNAPYKIQAREIAFGLIRIGARSKEMGGINYEVQQSNVSNRHAFNWDDHSK